MGYDLLENSDSFPQSSFRTNGFVQTEYLGVDGKKKRRRKVVDYLPNVVLARALGVGKGRRRRLQEGDNVREKFPDLSEKSDCKAVMNRIFELQTEMDAIRGKVTAGEKSKWFRNALAVLEDKMASAKVLFNRLNCVTQQQEKEQASEKAEIIDVLTQSTKVSTESDGSTKGTINKFVIYGIGGLFILGGIFILLKDKK